MAEYARPGEGNPKVKRTDRQVEDLARDYGGQVGQEGALLNGLLALGYDPAFVRSLADADPNRRYLDDAITRALRAGVMRGDIERALKSTRLAAEGKPEEAIRALGVTRDQLPPDSAAVFDAIAQRQPLPFLDRGQIGATQPEIDEFFGGYKGPTAEYQQATKPLSFGTAAPPVAPPRVAGPGATPPASGGVGGGAPAGGGTRPGTVTATTPGADRPTDPFPTDPSKVRDWVARNNPEWLFLLDIPEVAAIVKDPNVWQDGASDADLRGRLMQTDWWKRTEPAARQWLQLKTQDPASANDQLAERKRTLKTQAQGLGITIAEAEWDRIAEDSLKFAWTDTETQQNLGNYFTYAEGRMTGAASAADATLRQAARDWMVPIDDKTLGQWVTQVVTGVATTDYFNTYLANQARSLFPQLEDPISRGITPGQYLAPYKSIAAETLGLNPDDIDFREAKWMRAVNQVDDKGGRRPMTLYDWQNMLKTDEQYGWDKTEAGREHGASLARSIATQFGFGGGGRGL